MAAELCERGVLDRASTPVGGASAGSIIVACLRSGLPFDRVQDACLSLAADCRAKGTRTRLGPALESTLRELLPEDAHVRCSEGGTAHIAVTRLFPAAEGDGPPARPLASRLFRGELLSAFDSRDDLIGAVLTSSHIPWYLDGRPTRTFRGGECVDGGLTQFIPAIPGTSSAAASPWSSSSSSTSSTGSGSDSDREGGGGAGPAATRLVRVTCFPSRGMDAAVSRASSLRARAGGGSGGGGAAAATAAAALESASAAEAAAGAPPPRFADLSPDRFGDWGVSMREAVAMALEPAPEATLRALLDKGREDARLWMAVEEAGAGAASVGGIGGGGGGGGGHGRAARAMLPR